MTAEARRRLRMFAAGDPSAVLDPSTVAVADFDFSLSTDDVAAISALDQGDTAGADSDTFGH